MHCKLGDGLSYLVKLLHNHYDYLGSGHPTSRQNACPVAQKVPSCLRENELAVEGTHDTLSLFTVPDQKLSNLDSLSQLFV